MPAALLITATACAFAPPLHHVPSSRALRHTTLVTMQQPHNPPMPSFTEKAFVRRGGLVWPHVHAAWLLIAAVVEFCTRLGRAPIVAQTGNAPTPRPAPTRTVEPLFLQGALCERVTDVENDHEYYVCQTDVEDDEYACRCAVKDGKYVYFCTKPW